MAGQLTAGLAGFCAALLLQWLMQTWQNSSSGRLPPSVGMALPLIGHLHLIPMNPMERLAEWRRRLGDVFRLRMGSWEFVVLCGPRALREAMVRHADVTTDRPAEMFEVIGKGATDGVINASGANWKEQRTTTLNILTKQFGMGKDSLAAHVQLEVDAYLDELTNLQGAATDLRQLTTMCVSNVTCAIIFGSRFDLHDKEFHKLLDVFNEMLKLSGNTALYKFFPWTTHLPFDISGIKKANATFNEVMKATTEMVQEILKNKEVSPDSLISFVDAYVEEMNRKREEGQDTHLDESNLYTLIGNLFLAGSETTSNSLLWCYLFLLHNPEVQNKVYNEICTHVGTDSSPTIDCKSKLRYLQAVIQETLRLSNVVPLGLVHKATADITVCNYHIPKNTVLMTNLYSSNMDVDLWGDPEVFRPERFLDADENVIKREGLVPFGLGRRACLGESLARMEMFLFLANVLQRFELIPDDPSSLPEVKGVFGLTVSPAAYKIRLVQRQK